LEGKGTGRKKKLRVKTTIVEKKSIQKSNIRVPLPGGKGRLKP